MRVRGETGEGKRGCEGTGRITSKVNLGVTEGESKRQRG